jgi:molybdopterin converting factor small subunit
MKERTSGYGTEAGHGLKSMGDGETLRVRVRTAGALSKSLPSGKDVIEGKGLTVRGLIRALVQKHGPALNAELLEKNKVREGLSILVNGRNVLSLPGKFDTLLEDGDEVLIAIMVAGG